MLCYHQGFNRLALVFFKCKLETFLEEFYSCIVLHLCSVVPLLSCKDFLENLFIVLSFPKVGPPPSFASWCVTRLFFFFTLYW